MLNWNPVFAFWFAYVITRPSARRSPIAGQARQPRTGLGLGNGRVALALTLAIACLVGYLSVTRRDVQAHRAHARD